MRLSERIDKWEIIKDREILLRIEVIKRKVISL